MTTLAFDAAELYGYKILRDPDNQPLVLAADITANQSGSHVDSKIGETKRQASITAKIGDKIGDKAGIKGN